MHLLKRRAQDGCYSTVQGDICLYPLPIFVIAPDVIMGWEGEYYRRILLRVRHRREAMACVQDFFVVSMSQRF